MTETRVAIIRTMTAASIACLALGGCGAKSAEYYASRPYASQAPAIVAPPTAAAFLRRGERPLAPYPELATPAPGASVVTIPDGQPEPGHFEQDAGQRQRERLDRDRDRAALDRYQRDRLAFPGVPPAPFRGAAPGLPITPFTGARQLPGNLPAP